MVIPLVSVIVLAVLGVNTFACIGSGILSSYILGIFAGAACGVQEFLDNYLFTGIEDCRCLGYPDDDVGCGFRRRYAPDGCLRAFGKLNCKDVQEGQTPPRLNAVLSLLGNVAWLTKWHRSLPSDRLSSRLPRITLYARTKKLLSTN